MAPDLLVATCNAAGGMIFSNQVWTSVFGQDEDPWARLNENDRQLALEYLAEAGKGILVTNQIFMVKIPNRYEPLPVLLNFLPIHGPNADPAAENRTVTITGEALAEPTTWTISQTQRHRLETLGRMSMGIAHDVNNLLSGIIGHTELLKAALVEAQGAAPLKEHVHTIEQAALDCAVQMRKIQQYIRQEKLSDFELLDLPSLIQDCVTLTRPYWYNEPRRQGIAIACRLDLQEVPSIMGSASELRDVLVNMILNAVQAMPDGGTLTFSTRYDPARGVLLLVKDTGTGMTEQVRARIFEPLFTTKGARGSGMGLAITYGTIQEHDGNIDVASKLGEGTTFTLSFPPANLPPPAAVPESDKAPSRKANILVVDDEFMVRSVITKLLALKGHSVVEAASGAEALSVLEECQVDLIFTDQGMPEMNGREFARIVRDRRPALPIILLTGDTEAGEPDETVDVVLAKPFKLDQLEATIQELL
jgi:signal transduction histidine kinase